MKRMPFVLSILLVSGCAVGPEYHRPAIPLPDRFHSAHSTHEGAGQTSLDTWWTEFNDPDLVRLVDEGVRQSLTLDQMRARVAEARAAAGEATSALLPAGEVTVSGARARQSLETPLGHVLAGQPGFKREGNLYAAYVGIGWELDLFGGLRRGREAAVADRVAAEAGLMAATLEVQASVADRYLHIRGLQQRLDVARDQVATQARLADTIRLQVAAGVAPSLQQHQADGALASVRATIPRLEIALEGEMTALDILLARQPGTSQAELGPVRPVPQPPAVDSAGGPAALLRRRPDLIAAERTLAAANARIGAAVAGYYPTFSLSALAGTATTTAGHQFNGPSGEAQGVLGLRWRLFDFGRVDAEIKAAKARDAGALAAYRLAVLRASGEVEDALTAVAQRQAEAQILAAGEDDLAKAEAAAQKAYKGGAVSLIEVLDADSRLLQTRDSKVQAQTASAQATVSAFRALGGGWNPPDPSVAQQP
jgi:NodT family efflux transporter outer membrane factor (OMF) lipoprotein